MVDGNEIKQILRSSMSYAKFRSHYKKRKEKKSPIQRISQGRDQWYFDGHVLFWL